LRVRLSGAGINQIQRYAVESGHRHGERRSGFRHVMQPAQFFQIGIVQRLHPQRDAVDARGTIIGKARRIGAIAIHELTVAQLGVVLYMFLVGLELNAAKLRDHAPATLAMSHTGIGAAFVVGNLYLTRRITKRRKKFEAQFPDALSLIASSLSAGHTFLRAIQMMCEESEPPLSEEFARVVSETRLGDSVVDALARMAQRLELRDLDWVVQAIRIQQTVGGKLADLLHTLADFIRAREEVRREVNVLTAEGRMSAWVLGGLPLFLLLAIQVIDPDYLQPMFQGWGIAVLAGTAASVAAGTAIIFRMIKIEV